MFLCNQFLQIPREIDTLKIPIVVFFYVSDIDEARLKKAKEIGADYVLKITSKDPLVAAQAIEETVGDKVDISIECSGAAQSIQTAIYVSVYFSQR